MKQTLTRAAFLFALLLTFASSALAQSGTLTGKITDSETGAPLVSATVRATTDATSRQFGAITDAKGNYTIKGLMAGLYHVSVSYLSYSTSEADVTVAGGATASHDVKMIQGTIGIDEVVVSASRKPEKETRAPASVSVVTAREIEQQPALSVIDHVKEIPGIDIVQSGLTQSNVVARGFNNAFSGSLMVLTDNRVASVPSLRLNAFNFIPLVNEDIQQIEVIRGPGAALYGPNAANGVMQTITRSPFSSAGTWLSIAGGERNVFQGMARHAGTVGDQFGYKISAQYMMGTDWGFVDTNETGAKLRADTSDVNYSRIGARDSAIQRFAGEVRLDYAPIDDLTFIGAVGINQAVENVDLTGLGAGQVKDWRYMYYQLRVLYKDLFVQAFMNQSDAGETYLLRTGKPIVDRSTLTVMQAQHSYKPFDKLSLTYGVDVLLTDPVTDSTITGRNENDDNTTEIGGYLQAQANLVEDLLDVVGAARVDKHSRLDDAIISPRAALVFTPSEDHTIRFTYNRAYTAPTTNEMFLDIVGEHSTLFDVRGSGVPQSGYTFEYKDGNHMMFTNSFDLGEGRGGVERPLGGDSTLWNLVRQAITLSGDTAFAKLANAIPAPPPSMVGVELRMLNPTTGAFDAYAPPNGRIPDRVPVRPTINQTLELGYKGVIADRVVLSVDLYRSQYTDFVGPLEVITPSVFYNKAQLQGYLQAALTQAGMPPAQAAFYAQVGAARVAGNAGDTGATRGIPLATVSPVEASDRGAIMLTYRNYGDIVLYGYDVGLHVSIADGLIFAGGLSYVDKNFFENLDSVADLSLNAPKFKFTAGLSYENPGIGLNANVRMRHIDGYRVRSGVYVGDVKGYSVVDLGVGYRLPWIDGMNISVSAQNLLTFVDGGEDSPFSQRHFEFVGAEQVGAPALGRLILARLTYSFK